jgi:hypothetical protein
MNMVNIPTRSDCLLACLAIAMATVLPDARGGADMTGDLEDHHDEGPSYFGFVKDARGAPVADAKVTASIKNGLTLITRTTTTGMYKIGGMSKQVSPNDVTISCAKDGYRQTRIFRRTPPKADPSKPVETECRLERG